MAVDPALTEAVQLIRAGRKGEAQLVLEPYLQANPQDIQAWMWEAEIFPEDVNKVKVLEICLEHNPGNPQVVHVLEVLCKRAGLPARVEPLAPPVDFQTPRPAPCPEPAPVVPVAVPVATAPRSSVPATPGRRAVQAPQAKKAVKPAVPSKHPDWPKVDGVVDISEIHEYRVRGYPMYYAVIEGMYVVRSRDYRVRFAYARGQSGSPFNAEILTSNYPPGQGIVVSHDPRNPGRAYVYEWDPKVIRRKLTEFKDRPEVRKVISQRYRKQMLTGLGVAGGGIAATLVLSFLFSATGGYVVVFYGAIVIGVIYFIVGLLGWLWNMD